MPPGLAPTVPPTGVAMSAVTPRLRSVCLLIAPAFALAGCLTLGDKPEEPNAFPAQYRQEVVDTLTRLLDDPTNLRETGISDPALRDVSGVQRYVMCVRFNPRNANHEYIGTVERVGVFYGGQLTQLVKPEKDECRGAAYKPFPELEKICLGTKCA
jgi:hypothetical protein